MLSPSRPSRPKLVDVLSLDAAQALDLRIRVEQTKAGQALARLYDLMSEAAEGSIHVALGYASLSDYFNDAIHLAPSDAQERKLMVAVMSGKGLSQRAIASALGVGVGTVNRDLASVPDGTVDTESKVTKGINGKEYSRPAPEADNVVDITPKLQPQPEPETAPHAADGSVSIFCDTSRDDMRSVRVLKGVLKNVITDHLSVDGIDAMQELLNAASKKLAKMKLEAETSTPAPE